MAERTFKFNQKPIPVSDIPKVIESLQALHNTVSKVKENTPKPPMKIKVTYEDGSTFTTASLADIKEAEKMYVGKEMEASDGRKLKATSVEEVKEEAPKPAPTLKSLVMAHVNPAKNKTLYEKITKPITERLIRSKKAGTFTKESATKSYLNVINVATKEVIATHKIKGNLSPTEKIEIAEKLLKLIPAEEPKPKFIKPVTEKAKPIATATPSLFENKKLQSIKKKIKESCLVNNTYDESKINEAIWSYVSEASDSVGIDDLRWLNMKDYIKDHAMEILSKHLEETPTLKKLDRADTRDQDITEHVIEALEEISKDYYVDIISGANQDSDYWDEENGHPGHVAFKI